MHSYQVRWYKLSYKTSTNIYAHTFLFFANWKVINTHVHMLDGLGDLQKQYGGFWMLRTVPHNYMSCEIENNTDTCACIFYYKLHTKHISHIHMWYWSDHLCKAITCVICGVHIYFHGTLNENHVLAMYMCGTGQMTCRKEMEISRSTILDAKCHTTSLLQFLDQIS